MGGGKGGKRGRSARGMRGMLRATARRPDSWARPAGERRVGSFVRALSPARLDSYWSSTESGGSAPDNEGGASSHVLPLRPRWRGRPGTVVGLSRTRCQRSRGWRGCRYARRDNVGNPRSEADPVSVPSSSGRARVRSAMRPRCPCRPGCRVGSGTGRPRLWPTRGSDRPTRTAIVVAEERQSLPQIGYERPATVGDARALKSWQTHPAITVDRGGTSAIGRLRDPMAANPEPAAPAGRTVLSLGIWLRDVLPSLAA
jgi:hypothetical protein